MKLEQIESFLTVAKYMSITKAAEAMYISQSTVSRQIAALEKEIGQPLFYRLKKSLQLTSVGAQLLSEFSHIHDQYTKAISELKRDRSEIAGTLRFGYLIGTMLPEETVFDLRTFYKRHPKIDVIFAQLELPELLDGIQNGALDIAVIPQVDSYGIRELSAKTVATGALRLIYPEDVAAPPFSREFFQALEGECVFVVSELQYPCIFIAGKELCEHIAGSRLIVLSNVCTLQQRLNAERCVAILGPGFDGDIPEGSVQIELNPDRSVPIMVAWNKANHTQSLLLALDVFARTEE